MAELNINATPLYSKIYDSFQDNRKILILRGGTRSSKTYSMMQKIILWLYTGEIDGHTHYELEINGEVETLPISTVDVVRKNSTTLRTTVMNDANEIILSRGLGEYININKTEKIYTFQGRTLRFFGADDQQKVRGAKRDLLYCNESNELGYKTEFFQLLIRTRRRIVIDFNPDDEDIRINTELEQKRMHTKKDVALIVSTYKDNPFLTKDEIAEIEHIKDMDPYLWTVYGEGGYGKLQGAVFNNRDIIGELPEEAELIGRGMDFGFTNDPTTIIAVYRYNGEIILDEELYQKGLTNKDIDSEVPYIRENRYEVIADSAEPKSIEELSRLGRNIYPADKGPDSILYGINTLKKYKIQITARSQNLIKEFKKYKRSVDRQTGETTNKPIDAFNHGIDGLRYLAMKYLGSKPVDYEAMTDLRLS